MRDPHRRGGRGSPARRRLRRQPAVTRANPRRCRRLLEAANRAAWSIRPDRSGDRRGRPRLEPQMCPSATIPAATGDSAHEQDLRSDGVRLSPASSALDWPQVAREHRQEHASATQLSPPALRQAPRGCRGWPPPRAIAFPPLIAKGRWRDHSCRASSGRNWRRRRAGLRAPHEFDPHRFSGPDHVEIAVEHLLDAELPFGLHAVHEPLHRRGLRRSRDVQAPSLVDHRRIAWQLPAP